MRHCCSSDELRTVRLLSWLIYRVCARAAHKIATVYGLRRMSCCRTRNIARREHTVRVWVSRASVDSEDTLLIFCGHVLSQVASFAVLYVVGTRFKQVRSPTPMLMLALQVSVCL